MSKSNPRPQPTEERTAVQRANAARFAEVNKQLLAQRARAAPPPIPEKS